MYVESPPFFPCCAAWPGVIFKMASESRSVQPSLIYLIGDPEDPSEVWQKLESQFQKRTWANKLQLRRKRFSLRLKEGDSVQEHIKAVTEIFDGLSVIGDPISDEDRVVHLLASLPESYNVLVTALKRMRLCLGWKLLLSVCCMKKES